MTNLAQAQRVMTREMRTQAIMKHRVHAWWQATHGGDENARQQYLRRVLEHVQKHPDAPSQ